MVESIDEGTLQSIWSKLINRHPRHRTNYRNEDPSDYRIEHLRAEHYRSYKDGEYFSLTCYIDTLCLQVL